MYSCDADRLTEDGELGERAVADDVVGMDGSVDVVERYVGDAVTPLVVQHVVPMTERSTLDVLA